MGVELEQWYIPKSLVSCSWRCLLLKVNGARVFLLTVVCVTDVLPSDVLPLCKHRTLRLAAAVAPE